MNKTIFTVAFILTGLGLWWKNTSNKQSLPIVGVIQIIEHPALDQTRKGIFDELQAQGLKNAEKIDWRYESAQGNPALATQIAQKFIGENAAVIVTIPTTVSQSALQVLSEFFAKQETACVIGARIVGPEMRRRALIKLVGR